MNFKVTRWMALGLACSVFSLTNCKKDQFSTNSSLEDVVARTQNPVDVQLSYSVKETSYKNYLMPLDTNPASRHKLVNTLQQVNRYNLNFNVNSSGMKMVMDNMDFQSPIDDWNKKDGVPYKITNNGQSGECFDNQGRLIGRFSTANSEISAAKVYELLSKIVDKRPLQHKVQELISKEATITEDADYVTVRTTEQNQNFKENSFLVFSKTLNKLVGQMKYTNGANPMLSSMQILKYNPMGTLKENYLEVYKRLPDGDKETSVSIQEFENFNLIIN